MNCIFNSRLIEGLLFSTKSYGSHKNHPYRNDSHKGSVETIEDDDTEGEEKRDASKEDLDQDGKHSCKHDNSYMLVYV